jgi:GT2 family glycosyltransferase
MRESLLSVVVCTHDRPADLERCLRALAALEDPVEVIVVDSASTVPCEPVVTSFAASIARLRLLRQEKPGLSRARNTGLADARTALVAFVDDDAAPAPDWARRIAAPFARPDVVCVGGSCVAAFDGRPPAWLSARLLQFAGITRFSGDGREARSTADYPFGANVCFRRDALLEAGGFSERLGRTGTSLLSGEESDAIDRLRARGGVVWLEPAAAVDHYVAPDRWRARYYWRRLYWQGVSRARGRRSLGLALRLIAAAPVRFGLWIATGDRFYLFRVAETAGYLGDSLRPRHGHVGE